MFGDICVHATGKDMSSEWIYETQLSHMWPGKVPDNFAKVFHNKSWEQHLQDSELLSGQIKRYDELPPIMAPNL